MASKCAHPDCSATVEEGKKYCSSDHYQKRNKRFAQPVDYSKYGNISPAIQERMRQSLGREADLLLENMNEVVVATGKTLKTSGDWNWTPGTEKEYMPRDVLDREKIEEMLKIGIVLFALHMKLAPALAPFRDDNGWSLVSPDQDLADISTASLQMILPRFSSDFGITTMAHGIAPFEQSWKLSNLYELGLSDSRNASRLFAVPDLPAPINPARIKWIRRTEQGKFNGLVVTDPKKTEGITLGVDESLVMTYNQRYRSLWGHSFFEPIYPLAYWYQIVVRAMVRFLERQAAPVTVVEYPQNEQVQAIVNGNKTQIASIEAAMMAATDAAYTNSIVIPSNTYQQTGDRKWGAKYLEQTTGIEVFRSGIETISQDIFRAGISADLSLARASGGVGSYNQGDIHRQVTLVHSDTILTEWVWQLNRYFIPYYSKHNRGDNGPPIRMVVQLLDPDKRAFMLELMNQDQETYKDFTRRFDWESMAKRTNVPLLSEEDAPPKPRQPRPQPAPQPDQTDATGGGVTRPFGNVNASERVLEAVDQVVRTSERMASGENIPLVLSEHEWDLIKEHVVVK